MHSLFFKDYVWTFGLDYTTQEIQTFFDDLSQISPQLAADTKWLAKVMCGMDPRGGRLPNHSTDDERELEKANNTIRAVHRETISNIVKPYLITQTSIA
eukprot:12425975-Karenia_brevis.AAC.1